MAYGELIGVVWDRGLKDDDKVGRGVGDNK